MLHQQLHQMEDHHKETKDKHQQMMELIKEEYNKDRQQKEMSIQSLQGEMSMLQSLNEEIKDRNDELLKEVVDLQNTNNEKTKTIEELDVSLEHRSLESRGEPFPPALVCGVVRAR